MRTETPKAVEVFFSYAHEDEKLRGQLARHLSILQRQKVITGWHDREISAGTEWQGEIDQHLNKADIILLLISADFLASDYCYDVELKRAMERHEKREARVIPVILRSVDWHGALFGKLKPLPKNGKPVTSWENLDEAFLNIAQGIRTAVEQLPRDERSFERGVSDTQSPIPQPQPTFHKNKLLAVAATLLIGAVGYLSYEYVRHQSKLKEGQPLFNKQEVTLTCNENCSPQTVIIDSANELRISNFIAEAIFHNPEDAESNFWKYGFSFRDTITENLNHPERKKYGLWVHSNKKWELEGGTVLQKDKCEQLNISNNGLNKLRLEVVRDRAKLFVNDNLCAKNLDVSNIIVDGKIYLIASITTGKSIKIENFIVWSTLK